MSVSETSFATGLSISLVKEYAALIQELGLNDGEIADIITALCKDAPSVQSRTESFSPSASSPSETS